MRMLLAGLLVMLSVASALAHDRDDDDRCTQSPPCQCDCMCQCSEVSCACEITPQTCGRLRARECKTIGLRPGCRRCIPTVITP